MEKRKTQWFNTIIKTVLKEYNNRFYEEPYVYHYTTLSALLNILEKKQLWLSERNCMNDINDGSFVRTFVQGYITEQHCDNLLQNFNESQRQYIFSTSKEKDSIHQWQYYGSTGDEVCIEFNREELIKTFGEPFLYENYYYGSIFYTKDYTEESEEKEIIVRLINDYIDTLPTLFNLDELQEQNIQYKIVIEYLFSLIKQYGHHCEEEYRFTITEDAIKAKKQGLIDLSKNKKLTKKQKDVLDDLTTKFRTRDGLTIPYIAMPFNPKKLISSIIIGPNKKDPVAKKNLDFFLETKGLNNINVTYSSMSTR